jgi:hypothetical protein
MWKDRQASNLPTWMLPFHNCTGKVQAYMIHVGKKLYGLVPVLYTYVCAESYNLKLVLQYKLLSGFVILRWFLSPEGSS